MGGFSSSDSWRTAGALLAVAAVTLVLAARVPVSNEATVSVTYLLLVLLVAATSRLAIAVVTSIAAMLCLNFFFMPPVGTFTIADPHNWVTVFAFLVVSLVASHLSAVARARSDEAELTRQSEQLKTALLASLGHDLRTPLTAIRIAANNLKTPELGAADRVEQSDVILSEVERLTRLFQNLLEMGRIDAGAITTDSRWTHPSEIVAAARDQVGAALQHHRLEVTIDPDIPLRLDPRLTATALAHLLENAAQYSPTGSAVQLTGQVTPDGLTFEVRDHGPGIAEADLPHLFERFYRGTAARSRTSGTGMGLWIARGLLAAANGHVRVENCEDGGARFTLTVPAETPRTPSAPVTT